MCPVDPLMIHDHADYPSGATFSFPNKAGNSGIRGPKAYINMRDEFHQQNARSLGPWKQPLYSEDAS